MKQRSTTNPAPSEHGRVPSSRQPPARNATPPLPAVGCHRLKGCSPAAAQRQRAASPAACRATWSAPGSASRPTALCGRGRPPIIVCSAPRCTPPVPASCDPRRFQPSVVACSRPHVFLCVDCAFSCTSTVRPSRFRRAVLRGFPVASKESVAPKKASPSNHRRHAACRAVAIALSLNGPQRHATVG